MDDREGDTDSLGDLLGARRVKVLARSAPLAVAASIASILFLLIAFRNSPHFPAVAIWAAATGGLSLIGLRYVVRPIGTIEPSRAISRRLQASQAYLILASLAWAAGLFGLSMIANFAQGAMIAIVGTALFVGVLLVHRVIPYIAYFHLMVLGIALGGAAILTFGIGALSIILLLAVYAFTLALGVARIDRGLVEAVEIEADRREATQTIRLLLNDYEQQSSDWLWTVDAANRLRNVSERFAEACGRPAEELEGLPLEDLIENDAAFMELIDAIANGRGVRDLTIGIPTGDVTRQWRVSGRPRPDGSLSGVARDITVDVRNEERVAFMAHYDHLTGLANRYLFNERLRDSLTRESAMSGNVVMFYLDLDDFKAINDTRGHLIGDGLLREVGERLKSEVRSGDTVARLGGDEFAILMETRAGDSLLIERAHRFLSAVREPYVIEGQTYRISTSVGVARCIDAECDAEELMRRADLALYAAKTKGRDNFAMFEVQLDRTARARREMEIELAEALGNGEFRLHYQPIVDLKSGRVTALEALLRWHHPRRGMVSPANFLPVAEATGMIVPIGEWVIRQALHEMSMRASDLRLSINLSPTQVKDPGLLAIVAQALHTTNIAPAQIEFEITEHVLMEAGETNLTTLQQLHELGVGIALDDFGTGYSSLSYLRRFPFDRIKIDRHFVESVDSDADSRAIVTSVAQLALALGMQTTAEGVEKLDQLDALRELGIDEAQGFFISKPMPGDRIDLAAIEQTRSRDGSSGVLDYQRARAKAMRRRSQPASA